VLFGASRRLRELEEEVLKLKRAIADRDLDWDEMRARCKRLLDRTEKQYRATNPDTPASETTVEVDPRLPTSPERLERIKSQLRQQGKVLNLNRKVS